MFELSGGQVANLGIGLGVMFYQFVVVYIIVILIDRYQMRAYRKRGGKDGE